MRIIALAAVAALLAAAPPVPGAAADRDGDGLSDRRERELGSDPGDPATDRDGFRDGDDTCVLT
ncbi:MAG TPA: thrombospondin type 3 repeat-containing protein, partial [Solirubrobacteraceae bacterium]|nr:thrombospondin type 3 repeat-containing protein [Solirubrobacteraceae bacterium]